METKISNQLINAQMINRSHMRTQQTAMIGYRAKKENQTSNDGSQKQKRHHTETFPSGRIRKYTQLTAGKTPPIRRNQFIYMLQQATIKPVSNRLQLRQTVDNMD